MLERKRRKRKIDIQMAPLIDCVFLLLIFFMVATTFAPQAGIRVKLPPPSQATTEKPKGLIIRIANPEMSQEWGTMVLNDEIVVMKELLGKFQNATIEQKSMLIIQAERDVFHEQIVKIMDLAKQAGINDIGFAMVARTPVKD